MATSVQNPPHMDERFTAECDYCRTVQRCQWAFDGVTAICAQAAECMRRIARQRKGNEFRPVRTRYELKGERTPSWEGQDERDARADHNRAMMAELRVRKDPTTGQVKEKRKLTGEYAGGKSGYWVPKASGLKPEVLAWWGKLTEAQQQSAKPKDLQDAGVVGSYEMGRRTLKALRAPQS